MNAWLYSIATAKNKNLFWNFDSTHVNGSGNVKPVIYFKKDYANPFSFANNRIPTFRLNEINYQLTF